MLTAQRETFLSIQVFEEREGYYAEVQEGCTGSSTDRGGDTPAEVLNEALRWAGVKGELPAATTFAEAFKIFKACASENFEVRLTVGFPVTA